MTNHTVIILDHHNEFVVSQIIYNADGSLRKAHVDNGSWMMYFVGPEAYVEIDDRYLGDISHILLVPEEHSLNYDTMILWAKGQV